MWNTHNGVRTLDGVEAAIVAELLIDFMFDSEFEEPLETGIDVFDRLTYEQQMAVLDEVCSGLLDTKTRCPIQTAANEGAIAALFMNLAVNVEGEVHWNEHNTFRRQILSARAEQGPDGTTSPPVESTDLNDWLFQVDCLKNAIQITMTFQKYWTPIPSRQKECTGYSGSRRTTTRQSRRMCRRRRPRKFANES